MLGSYAKDLQMLQGSAVACNLVLRTLAFPFRHCTHATATACRFFRLSDVARR
jgi:hypothetical protein